MPQFTCPVCGYDRLTEPPYSHKSGLGSYDICSSCGYEYGVTDDDEGITHEQWRQRWIDSGMKWWSPLKPPADWDPIAQLARVTPPH